MTRSEDGVRIGLGRQGLRVSRARRRDDGRVGPRSGRKGGGLLFVVSAPSGAGKTTLIERLVSTLPDIRPSVSRTTRPPRKGERDGEAYHFVTNKAFDGMVAAGEFLEWAVVHGRRYGTPRAEIARARREGWDLVLSIDVKGAEQIHTSGEPCVRIFILPPSLHELGRRLALRGQDDAAAIERRLAEAKKEIRRAPCYDYIVVNEVFEDAAEALRAIVKAERAVACRRGRE